MTSIIIVSKNKKLREQYILSFCTEKKIDSIDISFVKQEEGKNLSSIGIEQIKKIKTQLYLKPIKSNCKAMVIEDAQLLTVEAQNSMLKILEEPPAQTYIFLSTSSIEELLPTIISRCKVIHFAQKNENIDEEKVPIKIFFNSLSSYTIANALQDAEKLSKDKENAILWLENCIIFLREKIEEAVGIDDNQVIVYAAIIKNLQETYKLLKTTNVNLRLAMENCFLSFVNPQS